MASLLLAHPVFLAKSAEERDAASPYFPLGLLYLAGYVREAGHDVAIFDATFEPDETSFAAAVDRHRPDVVGLSALQPSRHDALLLAAIASARGATVMLGGPDPTRDPSGYLADQDCDAVDLVVHHEGEQTVVALLDLVDADRLTPAVLSREPGVAYRVDGRVVINEPRPPIENLDELPLPARDLIDMNRYLRVWEDNVGYSSITIATARGCPFGCRGCRDAVHGDGFRQRSPESVAAEVQALSSAYDVSRLRVVDDVDGIDRRWFEAWAEASERTGAVVPFEPLNDIEADDLPLLDVQDSL